MTKRKPTPVKVPEHQADADATDEGATEQQAQDESKDADESDAEASAQADSGDLVSVRILRDQGAFKCASIASLPAEIAEQAVAEGWADADAAAVAQAAG